jgi:hypothetical protein
MRGPGDIQSRYIQSTFDKREGENPREGLAYRVLPLKFTHSASEPSRKAKFLRLTGFLPLNAVPFIEVRLYIYNLEHTT